MKRKNSFEPKDDNVKIVQKCGSGGCHSFQEKKKRYCKMAVKNGSKYCGAHIDEDKTSEHGKVKCILCKSLVSNLEKHQRVCNKVKEAAFIPNYYEKGLNCENYKSDLSVSSKKLFDFSVEEIESVIKRLTVVSDIIQDDFEQKTSSYMNPLIKELEEKNCTKALKHVTQQAYILGTIYCLCLT